VASGRTVVVAITSGVARVVITGVDISGPATSSSVEATTSSTFAASSVSWPKVLSCRKPSRRRSRGGEGKSMLLFAGSSKLASWSGSSSWISSSMFSSSS